MGSLGNDDAWKWGAVVQWSLLGCRSSFECREAVLFCILEAVPLLAHEAIMAQTAKLAGS